MATIDDDAWGQLPGHLIDVGQLRCLDAVRSYLRGVAADYEDLVDALSRPDGNGFDKIRSAWSLVDTADRLRRLLAELPGLKKKAPTVAVVTATLGKAESFRHAYQHPTGRGRELAKRVADGGSLLGELYFSRRGAFGELKHHWMIVGTLAPVSVPYSVQLPKPPKVESIGDRAAFIHLIYGGQVLDLTNLARQCASFDKALAAEVWKQLERRGASSSTAERLQLFGTTAPG